VDVACEGLPQAAQAGGKRTSHPAEEILLASVLIGETTLLRAGDCEFLDAGGRMNVTGKAFAHCLCVPGTLVRPAGNNEPISV